MSTEEIAALQAELEAQLASQRATIDELWLVVSAINILGLQLGFAMLETGVARAKNTKSILLKNLADMSLGVFVWLVIGFGLYVGDGRFVSGAPHDGFMLLNDEDYALFAQSYGFAITGTTIMSGAVLSRMKFEWYILISCIFVGLVYPVSAHWAWAENGFLSVDFDYKDYAGSGVVHMIGGVYGLVGAWVCGPRVGRFVQQGFDTKSVPRPLPGHSSTLQVMGVFLLTVSWMFFNAGSSGGTNPEQMRSASRALAASMIALSTSCGVVIIIMYIKDRTHHLAEACNAVLAGLVAITGPCGHVDPWGAAVIGAGAGVVYLCVSHVMLHRLHIDDPVDAFAVHGACGAFGVIMLGILDYQDGLVYAGSLDLLYGQFVGFICLFMWALITALILFVSLNRIFGISLDEDDQLLGLDVKYHEGYAYPEFSAQDVMEYNRTRDAATRKLRFGNKNRAHGSESWAASEASIHSAGNDLSFRSASSEGSETGWKKGRAKRNNSEDVITPPAPQRSSTGDDDQYV
ncbi:Ammonium transporter [Hondaea fermentalgiana]|uniref:Ammonium transporter n=1 Tax=Hondaea fermentalgiana TaxID=2315210 RepID=A0A2R5GD29_9STRA|nr:Ammonium transporter [Hondaea fermentalgiana]|eukprot:GBG28229.1 Ammonium transporter [Hondaea fermentalgiana]